MMDYIQQHKLISGAIVVLLIGAAWWEFSGSSSGTSSVVVVNTAGSATDTESAQIVSTLLQLQAVTLSGTIFNDPGFMSLQDFTTQVISEPIGRPNPFAPITIPSASQTTSGSVNPNLFAPAKP